MQLRKHTFTALITPFDANDHLDEEGLRFLIQRQLDGNIDGIVVLGTTGEAPTLSEEESELVIRIAREELDKQLNNETLLIVGTGSYSTKKTIENTLKAEKLGADLALIVTPYYNKPTQEGLYQHFKAVAHATSFPVLLYNVQGRTGQNLQTETLKRLLDLSSMIGVKETSGNISQISDVIELVRQQRPDFSVLSGDDALTLPLMTLGGEGVVSVLSNLFPEKVKALTDAIKKGYGPLAQQMHYTFMPLIRALFFETNPIPVKTAMRLCGLPSGHCRLPLCPMSPENELKLKRILENYLDLIASTHLPQQIDTIQEAIV